MESPLGFDMLELFEKILPLVESLWCALQMRYILWVAALLGACDVTQGGLGRHLGFYQKLEIVKKGEIDNFDARHVEYDIIKNFASFSQHFVLLSPKRCENTHFCSKMA